MEKISTAAWYVFKGLFLPLALCAGMFYNGYSFGGIFHSLSNALSSLLQSVMPWEIADFISAIVAFIPAVLAYPIPPGFVYGGSAIFLPWIFGERLMVGVIFVFCWAIKRPALNIRSLTKTKTV